MVVATKKNSKANALTHALETIYKTMFPRRSLAFPLALGIAMICLLIVVIVGWILVTVWGALRESGPSVYWVWLIVGTVILCGILAGVAFYLSFLINSIRISLRQANFIDAVTHELKSPIASLRLGLETMSRRQLTPDDMDKFTRAMKKDVFRLDRLISHLLDAAGLNVATSGQGNKQLGRETFDIREIIEDCIADVCTYHDFPEDQIQLKVDSTSQFGVIQEYEMIFRNLIDNAVKYSGDPPVINVSVSPIQTSGKPKRVLIAVENNGASVPESEKKRVFGRFERTEPELERTKPGVGLGLYIVQLLVKRNSGAIRLETPECGEGTRVAIELPIRVEESSSLKPVIEKSNDPELAIGIEQGETEAESDRTELMNAGEEGIEK